VIFEQTDVVTVVVPHRPGEFGLAATRLGENRVNIDYSYCGIEPGSNRVMLVFGVAMLAGGLMAKPQGPKPGDGDKH